MKMIAREVGVRPSLLTICLMLAETLSLCFPFYYLHDYMFGAHISTWTSFAANNAWDTSGRKNEKYIWNYHMDMERSHVHSRDTADRTVHT